MRHARVSSSAVSEGLLHVLRRVVTHQFCREIFQSDEITHGIDDLLCPICHEVMCEPVRMPCTHTFDRYMYQLRIWPMVLQLTGVATI